MKKTIVTHACCTLIAPLAFAQTSPKDTRQGATTYISLPERSLFARTVRIIRAVMITWSLSSESARHRMSPIWSFS